MSACSVEPGVLDFGGCSHREKLEMLAELSVLAGGCRSRSDAPVESEVDGLRARPWREFRELTGRPLFDQVLAIVRYGPPSPVRELAGDIMVLLEHPCAIGRLLELYEQRLATVNESPPLTIYRNLGLIGAGGAARALMSLWGGRWDADIAAALGMCKSNAAQNFLLQQAGEHNDSYVRQMCIAYLKSPLTKEKIDLFIDRLCNGSYNERYVAILKVQELRVVGAAEALALMRKKTENESLACFIKDALLVLAKGKRGGR
ncbi:MAG TPA: hypothetical protein DCZ93_01195 [Elusimicrobia bacterium]|nr:hypothetical protein [Elusimicrobiota bacterium]